jgi:hypothetical protein
MKLCKKILCVTIFSSMSFLHSMEKKEKKELPKPTSFEERLTLLEQQVKIIQLGLQNLSISSKLNNAHNTEQASIPHDKKPEKNSAYATVLSNGLEIKKRASELEEMQIKIQETSEVICGIVSSLYESEQEKAKKKAQSKSCSSSIEMLSDY